MKFKLFGREYEFRNTAHELPAIGNDAAWQSYLSGRGYASLSPDSAVKVAAVFRCVDIITKTMASLPLHLMKTTANGKEKAKDDPLYNLVYVSPNKYTTAYEFWQMYVANLLLTPRAVAKIERSPAGFIKALWNIPTRNTSEIQYNTVNGERYIIVALGNGKYETLHEGEFMYTPSFRMSSDSQPDDPLRIAADVLGLTKDVSNYAINTFRQGINPGGFVEAPAAVSDAAYERLKEDFRQNYSGVANAGKFIILEQGMKTSLLTRDMEKTQNLESRKFAIEEVCRLFGVPPHLCMSLEHSTFSNIEQQSLEFVRDCINPMSVRLEQTMWKDLLTEKAQKQQFFKFNTNGLLRGDTASRTQYYNMMRQNGLMNGDEIRALEDMNDMPDGIGKIYAINGNMIPLDSVPQNLPKGALKQQGA